MRILSWAGLLWIAMGKTGNGYHRPSLRNTGRGEYRRQDKLEGSTKLSRRLAMRCQLA